MALLYGTDLSACDWTTEENESCLDGGDGVNSDGCGNNGISSNCLLRATLMLDVDRISPPYTVTSKPRGGLHLSSLPK